MAIAGSNINQATERLARFVCTLTAILPTNVIKSTTRGQNRNLIRILKTSLIHLQAMVLGILKVEQGQGDANGYKTDGNYYLASGQNLPENGAWHIEVVSGGATNAVRQIARKANDNKIKTRFF